VNRPDAQWVDALDRFEAVLADQAHRVAEGAFDEFPAFTPPDGLGDLPEALSERARALLERSRAIESDAVALRGSVGRQLAVTSRFAGDARRGGNPTPRYIDRGL
jgi:hypothetical protein